MKYVNLIIKSVSLLLTVGALTGYQSVASKRAAEVEANRAEIARIERMNAEILAAMGEADSKWKDGSYQGTGLGFGGDIIAAVTVENGRIAAIEILSADKEDPAYYGQAVAVIDDIILSQDCDVDAVTGATFSSLGIMEAVRDALGKAENK